MLFEVCTFWDFNAVSVHIYLNSYYQNNRYGMQYILSSVSLKNPVCSLWFGLSEFIRQKSWSRVFFLCMKEGPSTMLRCYLNTAPEDELLHRTAGY